MIYVQQASICQCIGAGSAYAPPGAFFDEWAVVALSICIHYCSDVSAFCGVEAISIDQTDLRKIACMQTDCACVHTHIAI